MKKKHHGQSHSGPSKYQESKHPRGPHGKFAAKPGGPTKTPKETVGAKHLKDSGVSGSDRIVVQSKRVKKYAGHNTVESFVESHAKGKAHALRILAADHKAGRIKFQGKVTADHAIVLKKVTAKYKATVGEHIASHPKGPKAAAKQLAADHKAGRVKFEAPKPPTSAEANALRRYSKNGYKAINGGLRSGNVPDYLKSEIADLDAILNRSRLSRAMTLHRGINDAGASAMLAKAGGSFRKGAVIDDLGFLSTSRSKQVAVGFKGAGGPNAVHLEIRAPAGAKGLDMSPYSAHLDDEKEILFARDAKLRIISFRNGVLVTEMVL